MQLATQQVTASLGVMQSSAAVTSASASDDFKTITCNLLFLRCTVTADVLVFLVLSSSARIPLSHRNVCRLDSGPARLPPSWKQAR